LVAPPSHHRAHHAANAEYLDRNYGSILIIWDRLFRTFAAQCTPPCYGLTTNIHTFNPVRIATHEWAAMFHDVLRPGPLRRRLAHVFGAPGRLRRSALRADREDGDRPCESFELDRPEILESISGAIVTNRAHGALVGEDLAGFGAGAQPGGKVHR